MKKIDLRSDTVTLPSTDMLDAIVNADLGDDVFQEDLTVNKLEKLAAKITSKDSALFVPSGTMANLVAIITHCNRGDEVILGDQAHTFLYEAGNISSFGGVHSRQIQNQEDGTLLLDDIKNSIRKNDIHFPITKLICLENTHNRCSGMPLTIGYMDEVIEIAKNNSISVHVDGARIFNAAISLNVAVKDLVKDVDSVSFCLSKGLSAPAGSLICGSNKFIDDARRNRKALGGGMRQSGVLAAAGIIAIDTFENRITNDHQNARIIAEGISALNGININLDRIKTNIIYFQLNHPNIDNTQFLDKMKKSGIYFFEISPNNYRLVTNSGISSEDAEAVVSEFQNVLA